MKPVLLSIVSFFSLILINICHGGDLTSRHFTTNPGGYDQFITLLADATLEVNPGVPLPPMLTPDQGQQSLRKVLDWPDEEIEEFQVEAESFFRDKWGFDFSDIDSDENGIKVIPGVAQLMFLKFVPQFDYRAVHMSGRRINRKLDAMGWVVMITGSDVKYHGEFGGDEGVVAFPGELISKGVYHIAPRRSRRHHHRHHRHGQHKIGEVIHFQQALPGRTAPSGLTTVFCDIQSDKWGEGKGEGVFGGSFTADGKVKAFARVSLTFPGRLF